MIDSLSRIELDLLANFASEFNRRKTIKPSFKKWSNYVEA